MITFKTLVDGSELTTSAATYYTAGTNVTAIIKAMTLTNTSSSAAATATVHVIASGATEASANMIIKAKNLAAGESYTCPEAINHVIDTTGTIRALASAGTNISLKVSGIEVTQ